MPKKHLPAAHELVVAGVLTRDALRAWGLNPQLGDRVAREGDGLRLAPSTYVLSVSATDAQLVVAAREHAGDDCVITGLLACRLLELPDVPGSSNVDVLVPDGRRRVSTAYVRVSPTIRPPRYWLHASGARVADPHRAVADAARGLRSLQDVRALVLGALRTRWCGLDELRAEMDAGPSRGSALGRRVLLDWERGAWSAPEAELADVAASTAGLPPFLLNPTLLIGGLTLGQPDGWFRGIGLGWESDSRTFHGGDESFDKTLARHDEFGRHGLQLLHVTPRRARRMGSGYGDVPAAAVDARRRALQPEPPCLVVRPFDPRAHVVRDICRSAPMIDRSSGPVRWVAAA